MEEWALGLVNKFYRVFFTRRLQNSLKLAAAGYVLGAMVFGWFFLFFFLFPFIFLQFYLKRRYFRLCRGRIEETSRAFGNIFKNREEREALKPFFAYLEMYRGNPASRTAQFIRDEIEELSRKSERVGELEFMRDLKKELGERRVWVIRY